MFSKICVNGETACEVYKFLRRNSRLYSTENNRTRQVPWNFTKFLVCADGQTVVYFNPRVSPREMEPYINQNLSSDANILGMNLTYNARYSDFSMPMPQFEEEESKGTK